MQLDPRFALALLALANVVAFAAQGFDKLFAIRGKQRIRERTLLLFGLPLAALGMWLGMRAFRHKTSKPSFLVWAALVTAANIALAAALVWAWQREWLTLR